MPIPFSLPPHNGPLYCLRGRTQTLLGGPVGWKKYGAPRGAPRIFSTATPLHHSRRASPGYAGGPVWGRCGRGWASGSCSQGLGVSGWGAGLAGYASLPSRRSGALPQAAPGVQYGGGVGGVGYRVPARRGLVCQAGGHPPIMDPCWVSGEARGSVAYASV
jgi:hypothetical protein